MHELHLVLTLIKTASLHWELENTFSCLNTLDLVYE